MIKDVGERILRPDFVAHFFLPYKSLEEPSALPEGHGSEAELRDQETCIAACRVFNDALPIVEYLHLPKVKY